MALTPEQIIKTAHEAGLYQDGINTQLPLWVLTQQELERFASAIEAEVCKQDDGLIRQLVEALDDGEEHTAQRKNHWYVGCDCNKTAALTAARARLKGKP